MRLETQPLPPQIQCPRSLPAFPAAPGGLAGSGNQGLWHQFLGSLRTQKAEY